MVGMTGFRYLTLDLHLAGSLQIEYVWMCELYQNWNDGYLSVVWTVEEVCSY
jgi:hypothetical protein